MIQTLLYPAIAMLAGVLLAVQAPTTALLGRAAGSTLFAALVSFLVGTAAIVVAWLIAGAPRHVSNAGSLPWYAWIGGLYGVFFVASAAVIAPRIGVGAMLTAVVAGQLAAALVIDHYGLIGLPVRLINLPGVAGVALVFAGALLVRRG